MGEGKEAFPFHQHGAPNSVIRFNGGMAPDHKIDNFGTVIPRNGWKSLEFVDVPPVKAKRRVGVHRLDLLKQFTAQKLHISFKRDVRKASLIFSFKFIPVRFGITVTVIDFVPVFGEHLVDFVKIGRESVFGIISFLKDTGNGFEIISDVPVVLGAVFGRPILAKFLLPTEAPFPIKKGGLIIIIIVIG